MRLTTAPATLSYLAFLQALAIFDRGRTIPSLQLVKLVRSLLSIGIYYNPTASPSTIVLPVTMHLPISFANQGLARIG